MIGAPGQYTMMGAPATVRRQSTPHAGVDSPGQYTLMRATAAPSPIQRSVGVASTGRAAPQVLQQGQAASVSQSASQPAIFVPSTLSASGPYTGPTYSYAVEVSNKPVAGASGEIVARSSGELDQSPSTDDEDEDDDEQSDGEYVRGCIEAFFNTFCTVSFLLTLFCFYYVGTRGLRTFMKFADPIAAAQKLCEPMHASAQFCFQVRGHSNGTLTDPSGGILSQAFSTLDRVQDMLNVSQGILVTANSAVEVTRQVCSITSGVSDTCTEMDNATQEASVTSFVQALDPPDVKADKQMILSDLRGEARKIERWANDAPAQWTSHCHAVASSLDGLLTGLMTKVKTQIDNLLAQAEHMVTSAFQNIKMQIQDGVNTVLDVIQNQLCPEVAGFVNNIIDLVCTKLTDTVNKFVADFTKQGLNKLVSYDSNPGSLESKMKDKLTSEMGDLSDDFMAGVCNMSRQLGEQLMKKVDCNNTVSWVAIALRAYEEQLGINAVPEKIKEVSNELSIMQANVSQYVLQTARNTFTQTCRTINDTAEVAAEQLKLLVKSPSEWENSSQATEQLHLARTSASVFYEDVQETFNNATIDNIQALVSSNAEHGASIVGGMLVSTVCQVMDIPVMSRALDVAQNMANYTLGTISSLYSVSAHFCSIIEDIHDGCHQVFGSAFDVPARKKADLVFALLPIAFFMVNVMLTMLRLCPACVYRVSFYTHIAILVLGIAINLIFWNLPLAGILAFVVFVRLCMRCCCQERIRRATTLIGTSIQEVWRMGFCSLLLALVCFAVQTQLLLLALFGVYDSYYGDYEFQVLSMPEPVIIFALVWAMEVSSNILDVTYACLLGARWGLDTKAKHAIPALFNTMRHFGDICKGSIFLALLKGLQATLAHLESQVREKGSMNPLAVIAAFCACYCLEELVAICDAKAFAIMGLRDYTFTQAMTDVRRRFRPSRDKMKHYLASLKEAKARRSAEDELRVTQSAMRLHKRYAKTGLRESVSFNHALDDLTGIAVWINMNVMVALGLLLGHYYGCWGSNSKVDTWADFGTVLGAYVFKPIFCMLIAALIAFGFNTVLVRVVEAAATTMFVVLYHEEYEVMIVDRKKWKKFLHRIPDELEEAAFMSDTDSECEDEEDTYETRHSSRESTSREIEYKRVDSN